MKTPRQNLATSLFATFFMFIGLFSSASFAQTIPESMEEAVKTASMTPSGNQNSDDKEDEDNPYMEQAEKMAKEAASGGVFSTCTPNPFALCSGPRPSKKHKFLRACWNTVCP